MGGLSAVSARVLEYNEGREPDLLKRKYADMAANPFAFYRGTCHLFVDAWPKRAALNGTPPAWSCGDLHFENLGCYKGDNRLVYFDLNDFDEGALLPISWDITRFTASVMVGAPSLGVSAASAAALSKLYLDAFAAALAKGKARWVERETSTGMVRALLESAHDRKRKDLLDERTQTSNGRRHIRVDGVKALVADRADVARITKVVEKVEVRSGLPKFYRVLDVARRVAGCGSLGLPRWIVLVEGKGSPDGNYLLDLKEARSPASDGRSPFKQPRWKTDAERIVAVQTRVQAVSPALLTPLMMSGKPHVLRELQPREDRIVLSSWHGNIENFREAAQTMGRVTAWAALRASGRQGSAIADDLIAFAGERGWRNGVLAMARGIAKQTLADWRNFRSDFAAGRLNSAG